MPAVLAEKEESQAIKYKIANKEEGWTIFCHSIISVLPFLLWGFLPKFFFLKKISVSNMLDDIRFFRATINVNWLTARLHQKKS